MRRLLVLVLFSGLLLSGGRIARSREVKHAPRPNRLVTVTPPKERPVRTWVKVPFFSYQSVIADMAWDPYFHQVILLLAGGIAGDEEALDLLDPETGKIQRLLLHFPEGTPGKQLSQIAVGRRFLWFRNHSGANPTFRLDRSDLERARSVAGVQRSAVGR